MYTIVHIAEPLMYLISKQKQSNGSEVQLFCDIGWERRPRVILNFAYDVSTSVRISEPLTLFWLDYNNLHGSAEYTIVYISLNHSSKINNLHGSTSCTPSCISLNDFQDRTTRCTHQCISLNYGSTPCTPKYGACLSKPRFLYEIIIVYTHTKDHDFASFSCLSIIP